eukprot:TRINITY_DN20248_c0_g1_i1.p1 TRINITY_DN20248_c0_g1~~TRINITY_DN20248_c0_g1_i1.p1  ORF type:complete len:1117 (+),score=240.97 TRINITY_DN20248_c0_g1_i1:66-3416(+)
MCADRMPRDEGVPVSVATLSGVVVVVPVCSYTMVADVRRALTGYVECCYVTQYALEVLGGRQLAEAKPVLEQLQKENGRPRGLAMRFTPYCYRGLREHIAQTRLLLCGNGSDVELVHAPVGEALSQDMEQAAGVKGYPWFRRAALASVGGESDSTFDVEAEKFPFAAAPTPTSLLRGAMHGGVGGEDKEGKAANLCLHMADPLPSARLRGDILYLTVEFQRGRYGVAGSAGGFYLLESSDLTDPTPRRDYTALLTSPPGERGQRVVFPTLLGLLCHFVPAFQGHAAVMLRATTSRCRYCEESDAFEVPRWLLPAPAPPQRDLWRTTEHEYRINQPQDPRVPQRNWGANWVYPPDEAAMELIYQEFVRSATEAVMLSVDGTLVPLDASVPFEQRVFVSNGIVVAFCQESHAEPPTVPLPPPSTRAALPIPTWSEAKSELAMSWVLIPWLLWRSIYTLPVACIDYHGYRAWCIAHSPDVIDRFGSAASFLNTYRILTPDQNRQPRDAPQPKADTLRALAVVVDDLHPHLSHAVHSSIQSALLVHGQRDIERENAGVSLHRSTLRTYRGRDGRTYAEGFASLCNWQDQSSKRAVLAELTKKLPYCAPDAFPSVSAMMDVLQRDADTKRTASPDTLLALPRDRASSAGSSPRSKPVYCTANENISEPAGTPSKATPPAKTLRMLCQNKEVSSSCGTNEAATEDVGTPSKPSLDHESEGSSVVAEDVTTNRGTDPSDGEERSSTQSDRACVRENDEQAVRTSPWDGTLDERVMRLGVDVRSGRVVLCDPSQVRDTFHARGIPMRAIGKVLREVKGVATAERTLVLEGVIRSAKRELRALLRERRAQSVAEDVATFLNELFAPGSCLVASAPVEADRTLLRDILLHRLDFHFRIPTQEYRSAPQHPLWYTREDEKLYVLRGLCLSVGLSVLARQYTWAKPAIFRKSDILDLAARPHAPSQRGWYEGLEDSVKLAKEQHDHRTAALQLKHVCHDLARRNQWDSAAMVPPLHALAQLALHEGDATQATSLYARCVAISRLNGGVASPDYHASLLNYSLSLLRRTAAHGHHPSQPLPPRLAGVVSELMATMRELLDVDAAAHHHSSIRSHLRHLSALHLRVQSAW